MTLHWSIQRTCQHDVAHVPKLPSAIHIGMFKNFQCNHHAQILPVVAQQFLYTSLHHWGISKHRSLPTNVCHCSWSLCSIVLVFYVFLVFYLFLSSCQTCQGLGAWRWLRTLRLPSGLSRAQRVKRNNPVHLSRHSSGLSGLLPNHPCICCSSFWHCIYHASITRTSDYELRPFEFFFLLWSSRAIFGFAVPSFRSLCIDRCVLYDMLRYVGRTQEWMLIWWPSMGWNAMKHCLVNIQECDDSQDCLLSWGPRQCWRAGLPGGRRTVRQCSWMIRRVCRM